MLSACPELPFRSPRFAPEFERKVAVQRYLEMIESGTPWEATQVVRDKAWQPHVDAPSSSRRAPPQAASVPIGRPINFHRLRSMNHPPSQQSAKLTTPVRTPPPPPESQNSHQTTSGDSETKDEAMNAGETIAPYRPLYGRRPKHGAKHKTHKHRQKGFTTGSNASEHQTSHSEEVKLLERLSLLSLLSDGKELFQHSLRALGNSFPPRAIADKLSVVSFRQSVLHALESRLAVGSCVPHGRLPQLLVKALVSGSQADIQKPGAKRGSRTASGLLGADAQGVGLGHPKQRRRVLSLFDGEPDTEDKGQEGKEEGVLQERKVNSEPLSASAQPFHGKR